MPSFLRLAVAALGSAVFSLPAQALEPFASAEQIHKLADEEDRIWSEATDFDRVLRRVHYSYPDKEAQLYLQKLMDRLYPEMQGTITVRIARSHVMNAFAMPNGSIYINTGLVARMQNEAQLAHVLAHEGAHFVYRHGYQQRNTRITSTNIAVALSALGGIGALVGSLGAASAVYGHSRELESEADRVGFERAVRLGYAPDEGIRVFESLDEEAKILEIKEPLIFASHPKLEERIESYRQLITAGAKGETLNTAEFDAQTRKLRDFWLEQELAAGQYKSLIHHLANPLRSQRFGDIAWFYLGEAYRLRGDKDDDASAEAAYWESLVRLPKHAPALRGLGLIYLKRGQNAEANNYFRRYLQLAPEAKDAAYVKLYLEPPPAPATPVVESKPVEIPAAIPVEGSP